MRSNVLNTMVLLILSVVMGGGVVECEHTRKGNIHFASLTRAGLVLGATRAGPGVFEHPPSNSAPGPPSDKRQAAFESSSKII